MFFCLFVCLFVLPWHGPVMIQHVPDTKAFKQILHMCRQYLCSYKQSCQSVSRHTKPALELKPSFLELRTLTFSYWIAFYTSSGVLTGNNSCINGTATSWSLLNAPPPQKNVSPWWLRIQNFGRAYGCHCAPSPCHLNSHPLRVHSNQSNETKNGPIFADILRVWHFQTSKETNSEDLLQKHIYQSQINRCRQRTMQEGAAYGRKRLQRRSLQQHDTCPH